MSYLGFPKERSVTFNYSCDGGSLPKEARHHDEMPNVCEPEPGPRGSVPPLRDSTLASRGRDLARNHRAAVYGHPSVNFRRIGIMWGALFDLPGPVSPELVALALASLKIARLVETPSDKDSADDVDGYMETLRMIVRPDGAKWHDVGLV